MSSAASFLALILVGALALRVVLDIASIKYPRPSFDAAYAVLFLVVGASVLVDDASSYWGYIGLVISAWYLVTFFIRSKKKPSEIQTNKSIRS